MKPKNRVYCPQCNRQKLQFETKEKAIRFMKFNAEEIAQEAGYSPLRAYYCSACCCWHVTSHKYRKKEWHTPEEVAEYKARIRRSKHHLEDAA